MLLTLSAFAAAPAHAAAAVPHVAPPSPYTIAGTIYQIGGVTPATNANVWVNDTTQGFSMATTSSATNGHYQVDLANAWPTYTYAQGDAIAVAATWAPTVYTGSCSTTVGNYATSYCNVTLTAPPLSATLNVLPSTLFAGESTTLWGAGHAGVPPYTYNWSYGDGTPVGKTAQNFTVHTYATAGTYLAGLILNDSVPRTAWANQTVNVLPLPTLALAVAPSSPRVYETATFWANLSVTGQGWTYWFNFGDGTNSGYTGRGVNTATHAYLAAGTYNVNATAYNTSTGFPVQSSTLPVTVGPKLSATLASSPSPTEVGFNWTTLTATATNAVGTPSYLFAFGDGATAGPQASASASHTYVLAANVTGNVTVKDSIGGPSGTAFATVPLQVVKSVGVSLVASATTGYAPFHVTFTAAGWAGVGPYTYNFTLGNGAVITGNTSGTAAGTYWLTGTYTATVRVMDALGLHAWTSVTITVNTAPPLNAFAGGTPSTGTAPLVVAFSAYGTGGVTPYTFAWRFGDGGAAIGAYQNHTYTSAGTYVATVWVNDSASGSAFASVTTTVSPAPPLNAFASASPTSGTVPLAVHFGSYGTGGVAPYTYAWRFGDGTAAGALRYENHTYNRPGTFVSTVWVNDSASHSAHASVTITTTALPISAFATGKPLTGTAPLPVSFSSYGTGGVPAYTYTWKFGDGSAAASGQWQNHTYASAGTYVATVWVNDSLANSANAKVTITVTTVSPPLKAFASGTPVSGAAPLKVALSAYGTGGSPAYTFTWRFGDGSAAATGAYQNHTYATAGTYVASVWVNDTAAGSARATVSTQVTSSPSPLVAQVYGPLVAVSGSTLYYTIANISGGTSPYTVAWSISDTGGWITNAPSSVTSTSIPHIFGSAGTVTLVAYVNDSSSPAKSVRLTWTTTVNAAKPSSTPSTVSQLLPGGSLFPFLLLLIVILVALLVLLAVARRRKKKREEEEAAAAAAVGGTAAASETPEAAPEETPAADTPSEAAPEEEAPASTYDESGEPSVQLEESGDGSEADAAPATEGEGEGSAPE